MKVRIVDLFCGAGGTSTGAEIAAKVLGHEVDLTAVNHWTCAINTHSKNHPKAKHLCEPIELLKPREVVKEHLHVLVASPECTHHSNARGGKPINDQSRATAFRVVEWTEALRPDFVLIENVPEFATWGAVGEDGKRIKGKKGNIFLAYLEMFRAIGYTVEFRILNAADYGDPTTRRRLFIIARRGEAEIPWPEPTHCDPRKLAQTHMLCEHLLPWRAARECIDFATPSKSIFNRKRPLARKTIERVLAGAQRFGWWEPFLVILRRHMDGKPLDGPVPSLAANGQHVGLATPLIIRYHKGDARSTDEPIPTQTQTECFAMAEPFLFPHQKFGEVGADSLDNPHRTIDATNGRLNGIVEPIILNHRVHDRECVNSADEPLRTIRASSGTIQVAEPFMMPVTHAGDRAPHSMESPLPTITTANRGELACVEPFLVPHYGEREGQEPRTHNVAEPLPTVTCANRHEVAEGFLVDLAHGVGDEDPEKAAQRRVKALEEPVPTLMASKSQAITEPVLVQYNGTADARAVDEPIGSLTTKDRYALATPIVVETPDGTFGLDIRLRMLTPRELASAMSFPSDYEFLGNKEEQVRQIGNAVPVGVATALLKSILATYEEKAVLRLEEVA